jgi:membrane-bound metal-dependent hydrolase YbcI (DUF457 family)
VPTPIGHALAGLAVAGMAGRSKRLEPLDVAALVACAIAPDVDLVLNLFDVANHHRGGSHSIGAVAVAGLVFAMARRAGLVRAGGIAAAAAWATHLLLDYFGLDTSPPMGVMALWPFSNAFYVSPIPVFYDVPRVFTVAATIHNLKALAIELLIMGPIAWMCWRRPRNV